MENDVPPSIQEILAAIVDLGGKAEPRNLIDALGNQHEFVNVIEALQREIERGNIALDSEGLVVSFATLAEAA